MLYVVSMLLMFEFIVKFTCCTMLAVPVCCVDMLCGHTMYWSDLDGKTAFSVTNKVV